MEEIDFVTLWKEHSKRIDQSLALNMKLLREITNQKAEYTMKSLVQQKQRGIIAVAIYLLFLGFLLFFSIKNFCSFIIFESL